MSLQLSGQAPEWRRVRGPGGGGLSLPHSGEGDKQWQAPEGTPPAGRDRSPLTSLGDSLLGLRPPVVSLGSREQILWPCHSQAP